MRITFLGGAGTVTGSKFLVETKRTRILVDCGLFQGLKNLRERNWQKPPIDVRTLDAVVLTHAHIDHSGYLPVLVREGFEGGVYCTAPTRALCKILLADSARLQEEEAWYRNKKHITRHEPALPLYTIEDARAVTPLFREGPFDKEWEIGDLRLCFHVAGHILGAASVSVSDVRSTVLFSGDLGRFDDPLMPAPTPPPRADFVVMESTYGDREHPTQDATEVLAEVIERTVKRRGILLMSAFAVGRAQLLLYTIDRAFREGLASKVPVFLDSPMATDVTDLYMDYPASHRLSREECHAMCRVAHFVRTRDDSMKLNGRPGPAIIVSASGMLSGGRIVHHLKHLIGDRENTIALPGFQAPGTRGADLMAGANSVKIHGERRRVRAEVVSLDLFSAHADRSELLDWLGKLEERPRHVTLVHGEPHAADRPRVAIHDRFGGSASVAELGQSFETDLWEAPS